MKCKFTNNIKFVEIILYTNFSKITVYPHIYSKYVDFVKDGTNLIINFNTKEDKSGTADSVTIIPADWFEEEYLLQSIVHKYYNLDKNFHSFILVRTDIGIMERKAQYRWGD